ncbi:PfaB family protein [Brunnivagina elsteri]|uniref:Beta-ketoacyl synthase n=1 Tax=Brunnivagina elsteri CCALA 953 TaxID=987040 RepID=A0A2A2TQ76_9CYAN|nr:PfaB family protein [Calothrix elsteri]PAX60567.1 beta-ketoacyl synthase [Calothrix elsteri CCALA 953]
MEKIAIIGYSCLFPDAKNPDEFWHNLIAQKDSTSTITAEEMGIEPNIFYDPKKGKADKIYSLKGSFIRDFKFDSKGYKLPAEFLDRLDNTFKWSLYVAKQALRDCGYLTNPEILAKCGVILGTLSFPTKSSNQLFAPIYQQLLASTIRDLIQKEDFDLSTLSANGNISAHNAMISGSPAAIIAQALALSDIHCSIDAACSSPLYSIRLASHYLWTHKADIMLAGGISASDPLFVRMLFSSIQGYPENNDISRPLDKSSRGLMTAEGAGIFVLKRYSDAVRDGDRIYAVVAGNGLSNDGRGKHLLSPNSKGQVLAFERAYAEANLNPKNIDYMECHATGTLLGDTTEFNSIETFFGKHQASPLVGSAKANVGHLLTAAGSVGLIKVLLSMSKGVIPATINIKEPLGTGSNVISPKNVVRSATNWASKAPVKRAAVSAFGFGGTNAHIILEQGMTTHPTYAEEALIPTKIAIVGMDAFFGNCNGLDAFERSIYDGTQHFVPLPAERWYGVEKQADLLKQYGIEAGNLPQGAYLQNFDVDTLAYKIPPNELAKLNPQQLLLLKVADRALEDAGIKEGSNVAVLIATETEFSVHHLQQRWNLDWQVKEGLIAGEISLPAEKVAQLETVVKDGIHNPVETSEYVSYIGNIMASRISALWDLSGPTFTVAAGENSTFRVLEIAQNLLTTGEVDAVLVGAVDLAAGLENILLRNQLAPINTGTKTLSFDQKANGWNVGEGAGAVVLKRHDVAIANQERIYAVVDGISFSQQYATENNFDKLDKSLVTPNPSQVHQVCTSAFKTANIPASEVEYVEVYGSGVTQEDDAEIAGLLQAYSVGKNGLSCAIGSVKSNIGHTYTASGIASLIKTALCLYHRYIPGTPKWNGVKNPELWQGSPFYVASESRPWFLGKDAKKRVAAINGMDINGTYAHLILSEDAEQVERQSKYLHQTPFYLFPVGGSNLADLLTQLENLQNLITQDSQLAKLASQTFTIFQTKEKSAYTLAIVGRNQTELTKEIDNAVKGITKAFTTGEDWLTPLGSYFTPKPLGKDGQVAYIYPAAVNSYIGIGRNLFRLFPQVHEDTALKNLYSIVADVSRLVFPRSLNKLSNRQLENLEKQLLEDSRAIFETDMGFARLITTIIRDDFQVKPKYVFGYSLGETSMMLSTGVWSDFSQSVSALHTSPLFVDRVSGVKNAVREYWGMPTEHHTGDDSFWSTYLLMAEPDKVREALKNEHRVYLTQINTPEEVVIAGDTQGCDRVIQSLGCNAFRAPFNHAIHNEAMRSEYGEIVRINTSPAVKLPDIKFYSSAEYQPIDLECDRIAHSIGKCLSEPLDFPRLINQVYNDGARIFLETGSGNICSRWIDKTLETKPHITIPLNRRGVDDHTSIVRALAKLLSHQVPLNLAPLYSTEEVSIKPSKVNMKTVTVGGDSIIGKILTPENRQIFQNLSVEAPKVSIKVETSTFIQQEKIIKKQEKLPMKKVTNNSFSSSKHIEFEELSGVVKPEPFSPLPVATQNSETKTYRSHISQLHLEKLTANNYKVTQNHASFLNNRQEYSKQISDIIQLQLACAEHLLCE